MTKKPKEFLTEFHRQLKTHSTKFTLRNSSDILKMTETETISSQKYKNTFRQILKHSKETEWDIQCGVLYSEYSSIPLKAKNPFFEVTKYGVHNQSYSEYNITSELQNMLNISWEQMSFSHLDNVDIEEFDFSITIDDFILLEEKQKNKLLKRLKGKKENCLVFLNAHAGLIRTLRRLVLGQPAVFVSDT